MLAFNFIVKLKTEFPLFSTELHLHFPSICNEKKKPAPYMSYICALVCHSCWFCDNSHEKSSFLIILKCLWIRRKIALKIQLKIPL